MSTTASAGSASSTALPQWAAKWDDPERVAKELPGKLVHLSERGTLPVYGVDRNASVLTVGAAGLRLALDPALMQGAAVCVDSGRKLGSVAVMEQAPSLTRPMIFGALASLVGQVKHTPPNTILPSTLKLDLPKNTRELSLPMKRFALELALLGCSHDIESVCRELESKGYPEARVVEHDDARALVAVHPDQRSILVSFRPAMNLNLLLFAIDRKTVSSNGEKMPRGVHDYVSRIKGELDRTVLDLQSRYPEADLVVAAGSLGGGAAIQWLSRGFMDGTLDPDRVAHLGLFAAIGGVSRERVDEMRALLKGRLEVSIGNGDWIAYRFGARSYGQSITEIGAEKRKVLEAHDIEFMLAELGDVVERAETELSALSRRAWHSARG